MLFIMRRFGFILSFIGLGLLGACRSWHAGPDAPGNAPGNAPDNAPGNLSGSANGNAPGASRDAGAQQERFVRQYPAADVRALRIASSSSDVTIVGGDGENARVTATTSGDCKVDATLRHGEIGIVLHGTQFWSRCSGTLRVEVPRKVAVDVACGSGDLAISEVEGTLSLRTGSGQVTCDGIIDKVVAKSGSGNIALRGLRGPAVVSGGSGDVSLAFTELPEGTVRLEQGSGNVQIVVPHGPVATKVQTGSGSVDNQVESDPNAAFSVQGSLGSGDLRIRQAS